MLVHLLGEPGGGLGEPEGGGPVVDSGEAVRVGLVVHHPAGGAEHLLRRPAAGLAHGLDVPVVGGGGLGEVGDFGEPVVHLEVDVAVVVGGPGRGGRVVPDALEVGGQRAGSRGGDQQVAAVLEEERLQGPVRGAGSTGVGAQQLVGRQVGQLLTDVEGDSVEQGAVVVHVSVADALVRGGRRGVDGGRDVRVRVLTAVGGKGVRVVGACREEEPRAVRSGDGDAAVGPRGDLATGGTDADLGLEAQAVVLEGAPDGETVPGG